VSEPTHDVALVAAVALRLLEEYSPERPVRLLGVRVAGLVSTDTVVGDGPESSSPASRARDSARQLALPV